LFVGLFCHFNMGLPHKVKKTLYIFY